MLLCSIGTALAISGFATPKATGPIFRKGLTLATLKPNFTRGPEAAKRIAAPQSAPPASVAAPAPGTVPTFGHPVMSGIQGVGFEVDLRLDPSNPNRIYQSAPGSESSDTSWIWHSLDGGLTFKWVPAATPYEGKPTVTPTHCAGGGDSELGIAMNGSIYFCDLTLANFSVARSDDSGATFPCSNTGVPDTVVDRQWYTFDGDPLNGGSIYLTNDEAMQSPSACGGPVTNFGANILVMYRSPVTSNAATTAGLLFGPANKISNPMGCDEGIMGNDEVSPVATTLGQPDSTGGFTTLPAPVKHIFVVHDNANLNKIMVGRCFPVAFGAPVTNVSDPSGLNCVDLPVADLGPNAKTGGDFPTVAIDKAGNLYTVWEQAPIDTNGNVTGDTVLMYSFSTNEGNTWSTPMQIDTSGSPVGTLHNNVFAWIAAGDDGRIDIAWYGTTGLSDPNNATCGQNATNPPLPGMGKNENGPDACTNCIWSLWMVQTLNGHNASPTFTAPILASEHFNHRGTIQTLIGGQCGDRTLGDFLQMRMGAQGEAEIGYSDSNNVEEVFAPHAMFVRQNGGPGLITASSPVKIAGLTPFNSVTDPTGDGTFQASGTTSANMPQLDITGSNISIVTTAPCSTGSPCYRVEMDINNLSLAPTTTSDPDTDLVWHTQWLVPSSTDSHGGKNLFVYAESTNGGALQCFFGQNAATAVGGGVALTYPGESTALPAANCQSTLGSNGKIVIYVPFTDVFEGGAIDNKLHEVTASTMTLQGPANAVQPTAGLGGSLFNLIDVAQTYVFSPLAPTSVVSRMTHGSAGTFDIALPLDPAVPRAVEPRSSTTLGAGNYTLVFTFPVNLASVASATVSSGTGTAASGSIGPNPNQYTVNLTGVADQQYITITLNSVVDVVGDTGNVVSPQMGVLIGDIDGSGRVDSTDTFDVRQDSLQTTNSSNFRADVDTSGRIDSNDVFITRQQSLTSLPAPP